MRRIEVNGGTGWWVRVWLGLAALLSACGTLPDGWLYVTGVTGTSASIVWTGEAIEGVRCTGPAGETPASTLTGRGGVRYARLDGLQPDTTYRCRLVRADGRGRRVRVRTAPAENRPFVFAAVGDSGDGSRAARRIARRILAARPAFLLHLGDLAYPEGSAQEFDEKFFAPYRRVLERVPLFPTPGNHDLTSRSCYGSIFEPVADGGPLDPYGFDWAGTRFLSVPYRDLRPGKLAGPRWLRAELAAARLRPWRVLFLHEPIATTVRKGTEVAPRALRRTAEEGNVNLLLAGHAHVYERAQPSCVFNAAARLLAITSGGGGSHTLDEPHPDPRFAHAFSKPHFLRVRVGPEAIDIWAIGVRGQILDHVRHGPADTGPCRSGTGS